MRSRKGMTLIEVVIALAIFAMIMVAIFPAFIVLNKTNVVAKENVTTNYMAQDISEMIYNYSQTIAASAFIDQLVNTQGYTIDSHTDDVYELSKTEDSYQIELTVKFADPDTEFVTVVILVMSTNATIDGQQSRIETIVSFGE